MKIIKMLTAKKSEVASKAAERIGRQLKRNQEKLIDDLDAKKDALLSKKEQLESITIETPQIQLDKWATDYQQVVVDIALVEKEMEIASATLKELF